MQVIPPRGAGAGRALPLTAAFALLLAVGLLRHEMWRDELQAWSLAAASTSVGDLFARLRYDGHPALWYLLLHAASRATWHPEAMQAVHWLLASAGAWVFARHAPFPFALRALFLLGYLPLYEYGVISRNYAAGALLLFVALALWPRRRAAPLPLAAALALLANCNAYAWLLALALGAALLLEARGDADWRRRISGRPGPALLAGALLGAGLFVGAATMLPAADGRSFATAWYPGWRPRRALRVLATLAQGYLPLPDPAAPIPWNTPWIARLSAPLQAALGTGLLAGFAALLARRRDALSVYLLGSGALLAFTYLKYVGLARHHGHHFLLLVACCWLAEAAALESGRAARTAALRRHALGGLLAVHLATGAWLFTADLLYPFSGARAAAAALASPPFAGLAVAGYSDVMTSPVAAYLGRPLFYPQARGLGTYVVFDRQRDRRLGARELCQRLRQQLRLHPEGLAFVAWPGTPPCGPGLPMQAIATARGELVREESFSLFLLPGSAAAPANRAEGRAGDE